MSEKDGRETLVEERQALAFYLDALLREIPSLEEMEATVAPPAAVAEQAPAPAPAPVESIIPSWAEGRFPVLLFRAGGLTLAVPLVELSGVQEWKGERVTPMPGHAPYYLGLTLYRGRNVPVVDAAQLVLPPDRLPRLRMPPGERVQRIVFIDDGRWGLACDDVAEVVNIGKDQVRWRTSRTRRKWLAGTVIDHMCALIDPPKFAEMLATGQEDEPGAMGDAPVEEVRE